MNIILDKSSLGFMSSFEKITKAKIKDFVEKDDLLLFIVQPGELFKAIGPKGANVKRLSALLKKRIKIVEFSDDVLVFVKNMIHPLKATNIEQDGKIITISSDDAKTKGLLIGRNAQNLRQLEKVVKRHFDIDEIKVV
ncbi:NusA-like transcription termination signal-binding factor [Candidatus Woesearchaeota archaeon]|nr:NusA-like transcription termination signal-binding factor [Candidatus Woesearchaeota archaeon]